MSKYREVKSGNKKATVKGVNIRVLVINLSEDQLERDAEIFGQMKC